MEMSFLTLKNFLPASFLCAVGLIYTTSAYAIDKNHEDEHSDLPITIAVIGDWPYNKNLLDNAHLLTDSVNAEPLSAT